MKRVCKAYLFLLILFIVASVSTSNIAAHSNGLPFSVEPILPENQKADVGSYISVVSSEHSLYQDVKFKLSNQSNQAQEIMVTVVDAYTSPNGVIQYVQEESDHSKLTNEKYKLSNYLAVENNSITLSKGESKIISVPLRVDSLDGVLLGGVSFRAIEEGEEQSEEDSTFTINNEINMVIGVMATFETDKEAEFLLGEPVLDPMPSYYAIRLPITLDAPLLIQNAVINYEVTHQNEQLFKNEKTLHFAPYTKTTIAIPFEHDEISENGSYTIKGELIYQDKNAHEVRVEFAKTFEYVKENDEENVSGLLKVPTELTDTVFSIWTIVAITIPIFILCILIFWKRKNKLRSEAH